MALQVLLAWMDLLLEDMLVAPFPLLVAQSLFSLLMAQSPLARPVTPPPFARLLATKRGKVTIRSAAVHRNNQNVLVDLTLTERRLFTDTEADGRSEAIQERIMGHHTQTILLDCKNMVRRQLADMKADPSVRAVIQSHCGKHRSVAMAELLAKECEPFAEIALFHMEAHRWDKNYAEAPHDDHRAPKRSLVIRPVPSRWCPTPGQAPGLHRSPVAPSLALVTQAFVRLECCGKKK